MLAEFIIFFAYFIISMFNIAGVLILQNLLLIIGTLGISVCSVLSGPQIVSETVETLEGVQEFRLMSWKLTKS